MHLLEILVSDTKNKNSGYKFTNNFKVNVYKFSVFFSIINDFLIHYSPTYINNSEETVSQSQNTSRTFKMERMEFEAENTTHSTESSSQSIWKNHKLYIFVFTVLITLSVISSTICCTLLLTRGSNLNRMICNIDHLTTNPVISSDRIDEIPNDPEGSGHTLEPIPNLADRWNNSNTDG